MRTLAYVSKRTPVAGFETAHGIEQADEAGTVEVLGRGVGGQGHRQATDDGFHQRQVLLHDFRFDRTPGAEACVTRPHLGDFGFSQRWLPGSGLARGGKNHTTGDPGWLGRFAWCLPSRLAQWCEFWPQITRGVAATGASRDVATRSGRAGAGCGNFHRVADVFGLAVSGADRRVPGVPGHEIRTGCQVMRH